MSLRLGEFGGFDGLFHGFGRAREYPGRATHEQSEKEAEAEADVIKQVNECMNEEIGRQEQTKERGDAEDDPAEGTGHLILEQFAQGGAKDAAAAVEWAGQPIVA